MYILPHHYCSHPQWPRCFHLFQGKLWDRHRECHVHCAASGYVAEGNPSAVQVRRAVARSATVTSPGCSSTNLTRAAKEKKWIANGFPNYFECIMKPPAKGKVIFINWAWNALTINPKSVFPSGPISLCRCKLCKCMLRCLLPLHLLFLMHLHPASLSSHWTSQPVVDCKQHRDCWCVEHKTCLRELFTSCICFFLYPFLCHVMTAAGAALTSQGKTTIDPSAASTFVGPVGCNVRSLLCIVKNVKC